MFTLFFLQHFSNSATLLRDSDDEPGSVEEHGNVAAAAAAASATATRMEHAHLPTINTDLDDASSVYSASSGGCSSTLMQPASPSSHPIRPNEHLAVLLDKHLWKVCTLLPRHRTSH